MRLPLLALPIVISACGLARDFDQYNEGVAGSPAGAGSGGASAGAAGAGGSAAGAGGTANTGGASSGGGANTGGAAGSGNSGGSGNAAGANTGGSENSGGASTGGSANTGGANTGGTGGGVVEHCGNGKLDAGEECDDGAKLNGDGCSSSCRVTCADLDGKEFVSDGRVHCYSYNAAAVEWPKAEAACATIKGRHLVTIRDAAENNFVGSVAGAIVRFWIGLSDGQPKSSTIDAKYSWITQESLGFVSWLPTEPNNLQVPCAGGFQCIEHRGAMQPSGGWGDRLESEANPFVCEWEPPPY